MRFAGVLGVNWYRTAFEADLRNQDPPVLSWHWWMAFTRPVLSWTRKLRRLEDLHDRVQAGSVALLPMYALKRFLFMRASVRLGFSIPLHTFGPGLSIAHYGTIAVHRDARIGRNCRIHQGVTIGSQSGAAPIIGDDCFIGANACVIGPVRLGNRCVVAAMAVVTRSFGDDAILVGSPARDIRSEKIARNGSLHLDSNDSASTVPLEVHPAKLAWYPE